MKTICVGKIFALALAGATLSATSALAAGSDSFNRPKLGATWVNTTGKLSIVSDQLKGKTLSLGYLKASSKDVAASAVVFLGGTDLEYGAVALGNIAGGSNAFVKIQSQNGGGTFDHAGFYTGNNVGGNFFTLSSTVPSPAVLDVSFCGTVATMRITSAAGVQTYTYDYGTSYGPGAGAGTYGSVALDNFIGYTNTCTSTASAVPARAMRPDTDKSLAK